MGGTVILVSGPSFSETDDIMCKFDGINEPGVVISGVYAACTSPWLPTIGRVPFQLYINNKPHQKDAIYYSGELCIYVCLCMQWWPNVTGRFWCHLFLNQHFCNFLDSSN